MSLLQRSILVSLLLSGCAPAAPDTTPDTAPDETTSASPGGAALPSLAPAKPGPAGLAAANLEVSERRHTIGGRITGLRGEGLLIGREGSDPLLVHKDGAFLLPGAVARGEAFEVKILAQPVAPPQVCSIAGGSGVIVNSDVRSVTINCRSQAYAIAGNVTGLVGSGMVVSQSGGRDRVGVSSNGGFAFPSPLETDERYAITIERQPRYPSQTCVVADGEGTVRESVVDNVRIDCTTNQYLVGGSVIGLFEPGLVLALGDQLLELDADTTFNFPRSLTSGTGYRVTIASQPSNERCALSYGIGQMLDRDIVTVQVTCAMETYTIGGTISGLLDDRVKLQRSAMEGRSVYANGEFSFNDELPIGTPYEITVVAQPRWPRQECIVVNGTGIVGITPHRDVRIECSGPLFTLGVAVSNLHGSLVIGTAQDKALTINASGEYTMPTALPSGQSYELTVLSQPAGSHCAISSGAGVVSDHDVSDIQITCAPVN